MIHYSSHAALDAASRLRKATKIERLLAECAGVRFQGRMLEVGTGSGQIAAYFATKYEGTLKVDAVDVVDQRVVGGGVAFQAYDGERLPFEDRAFNLVVSNHVIEHVGSRESQRMHLLELARVLRTDGVIYLAAPSKWQFIEPHFRLAGLSWLPAWMRDGYVRLLGKGSYYDCNPMGHRDLEGMAAKSRLQAKNLNAQALRDICRERGGWFHRILLRIPSTWLARAYRVSPTMVYVLAHKDDLA